MRKERILYREEDIFSSTLAFWLFLRDTSPGGSRASDWISRDRRFRDMVVSCVVTGAHRTEGISALSVKAGLGHRGQVKGNVAW